MTLDPAVGMALASTLACILGVAAWHKFSAPAEFEQALAGYGIVPSFAHTPARFFLASFELASALLLIVPVTAILGAVMAAIILSIYAAAMAHALMFGKAGISCGCHFGQSDDGLSWSLVWRNAGLVALALALLVPASRVLTPSDILNGGATGLCVLILFQSLTAFRRNQTIIKKLAKRGS